MHRRNLIAFVAALVLAINFAAVPNQGALTLGLAAIAVAGLGAFLLRERRASNPLYDLRVAGRRVFWVAACAGVIAPMSASGRSRNASGRSVGWARISTGIAAQKRSSSATCASMYASRVPTSRQ